MIRYAIALVCVVLAVDAGVAQARVTFKGSTSQDRLARVIADDSGVVRIARVRWRADCREPGYIFRETTSFVMPLDLTVRRRFRDAAPPSYVVRDGRIRTRVSPRIAGRKVGPRTWAGSFRARVVVRRAGRVIDVCAVRGVRWRARRAA